MHRLSELPAASLFHSPGVGDALCALLMLTRRSLAMTCYCFDLPTGVGTIESLLRRGVYVQLVLDANQMKNASCKKQHDMICRLFEAVDAKDFLVVKSYSPPGGFACTLHAKTWCLDAEIYIGGSFNFTNNADCNNEERLVVLNDEGVVQVHKKWYAELWGRGTTLSQDMVKDQMAQRKVKEAGSRETRSASATRGPLGERLRGRVAIDYREINALGVAGAFGGTRSAVEVRSWSDRAAAEMLALRALPSGLPTFAGAVGSPVRTTQSLGEQDDDGLAGGALSD